MLSDNPGVKFYYKHVPHILLNQLWSIEKVLSTLNDPLVFVGTTVVCFWARHNYNHRAEVSIKAGYRRSTATCRTLTAVCLDFINENKKRQICEKANSVTTTTTGIFTCYKNSTPFYMYAQNTGNCISELLDFKFFWGEGHAPRPP